jgi:hypothetical protein
MMSRIVTTENRYSRATCYLKNIFNTFGPSIWLSKMYIMEVKA